MGGKGKEDLLGESVCDAGCSAYGDDYSLLLGVLGNESRDIRQRAPSPYKLAKTYQSTAQ